MVLSFRYSAIPRSLQMVPGVVRFCQVHLSFVGLSVLVCGSEYLTSAGMNSFILG